VRRVVAGVFVPVIVAEPIDQVRATFFFQPVDVPPEWPGRW
jgi:hypothetical protein